MILICKYIVPNGYSGITIFPFVFLKHNDLKKNLILLNHEKIHMKQQLELLIIPFYLIYFLEFLIKLIKYRNWNIAYRKISFEKESYKNENDLNYLVSRSFWAFIKYYD